MIRECLEIVQEGFMITFIILSQPILMISYVQVLLIELTKMVPLSKELLTAILSHDTFISHLNTGG